MRGLNKVMLIGNLGKEPLRNVLDGGICMVRFPLATSDAYKDKSGRTVSQTEWHNIVAWRGLGELAAKHLHKGSLIYVEGRLHHRAQEDKTGRKYFSTEIIADNIVMLDKKVHTDSFVVASQQGGLAQNDASNNQPISMNEKDLLDAIDKESISENNLSPFVEPDELL